MTEYIGHQRNVLVMTTKTFTVSQNSLQFSESK